VEKCEGLLLSGGGELPSALVDGQNLEPSTEPLIAERYRVQRQFLECALEREKPVIAVCYGSYLVNDHFGGRLTWNVHKGAARRAPGRPHEIRVEPGLIPGCETKRASVNSFHHQGIVRGQLATELDVICCDEPFDIVEAARHRSRPILCIQWHPERPSPDEQFNRAMIESFLSKTR
jgi:gamma-glutamyl-gamma-aminobutyrate hydrolase PuuD